MKMQKNYLWVRLLQFLIGICVLFHQADTQTAATTPLQPQQIESIKGIIWGLARQVEALQGTFYTFYSSQGKTYADGVNIIAQLSQIRDLISQFSSNISAPQTTQTTTTTTTITPLRLRNI